MKLNKIKLTNNALVSISGSKSISNRLLILEKLFGNIIIDNISNSQDTQLMQKALSEESDVVDIHHAGTAMRFLTSLFSIQEDKKTIITGSERMKQRPIHPLVDALRQLGAEINYIEKEGYPPLEIYGKKIVNRNVTISANVSSQFITSLLLIGAVLENGLEIELKGEVTSKSYIMMTLRILKDLGIETSFNGNIIKVENGNNALHQKNTEHKRYTVESDWSSASYFYSLSAIARKPISLTSFHADSLQGDAALKEIYYQFFGIKTISKPEEHKIELVPEENFSYPTFFKLNMNDCPDIAQTVCVSCVALQMPFEITGLGTLKVKETDRLVALQNELEKIGCKTEITENTIKSLSFFSPQDNISIETYNDHRMAMSFAPFALINELEIQNDEVVEKSYPDFWKDFLSITQKASF